MNKFIFTAFCLLTIISTNYAQEHNPINIGFKDKLYSHTLNETREFWVSLPNSYYEEGASYKKYPLLIVLDGNVHFKSVTGMVNYMSSGYNGNLRIPEMIVVAIQNVNRRRDFTPDKIITTRKNDSGGGENFLSFIEEELIPELDKKYRTVPYRILFGHSLGGLFATHAYMKEQTLFNSFIAVDPSLGTWDTETMDKKLTAVTENSYKRFLYIASANWGKRNIRNRDRHIRLYESLNSKCKGVFPAKLEYFENENHGSVPLIAFYKGLSAIFNGYGISYRNITSKEQLLQHFNQLSERLSWDFSPPESLINRVGYHMLQSNSEDDRNKAIEIFHLNTVLYPLSYNAFDSLGEAYMVNGNTELAIVNYKKSLELNINNENARTTIKKLKK